MPSGGGRDQRLDLDEDRACPLHAGEDGGAGRGSVALAQKELRRVRHLAKTAAGHLENADLVGGAEAVLYGAEDAEMMTAFALEIQNGIDHVLDDARARDLAVLGDMADEDDGSARLLGIADHRLRRGAHLRHRSRRRLDGRGPERLHGIEDHQRWRAVGLKRREDVLDAGLGRQRDRSRRDAHALGPEANLRNGLLAGDVDDPFAALRQRRRGLQEKCRLADARIAADQDRRAAHEAAARHPVELGDAGGDARRGAALAGKRMKFDHAALLRRPAGTAADAAGRVLLDEGIPLAASLAAALPAGADRAAILADILNPRLGHQAPPR